MKKGGIFYALLIFALAIIFGAFMYSFFEGWTLLDSFYFVIITLTTIGYGDLSPVTNAGKLFTMFFAFFGVAFALYLFARLNGAVFKKHVGEKVSEIKRDVKKQEELKTEVKDTIKKAINERIKKKR